MSDNVISWNVSNIITVGLMALIASVAVGIGMKAVGKGK